MAYREYRADISVGEASDTLVTLYECTEAGQWGLITTERFGPFDTALEITSWLVRHLSPRLKLPLR